MHKRRIVPIVAAAMAPGLTQTAKAAIISGPVGATSGTVSSGQTHFTVFSTQRTADANGFRLRQVSSNPSAVGRYVIYSCNATAQISFQYAIANQQSVIPHRPGGGRTTGCFRVAIRREHPADTNGILPGSGNTTFNLEVLHS